SLTIPALDQTPLLNTSNTRFSSVSGFQMGHSLHPPLWIGSPPSRAGRLAVGLANKLGVVLAANIAPAPKMAFCFIKSLLLNDFFEVSICDLVYQIIRLPIRLSVPIITACYLFYIYKSNSRRMFPAFNKLLVALSAS